MKQLTTMKQLTKHLTHSKLHPLDQEPRTTLSRLQLYV